MEGGRELRNEFDILAGVMGVLFCIFIEALRKGWE
jgi:hypothetical protein